MAISNTTNRYSYAGNGSTVNFAYPNYFLASGDLRVYKNGVLQTLSTHYTVTGAGVQAGGTVTFLAAPANGDVIIVFRDPALTQGIDLVENDTLPAETLEIGLDRLTMIAQRLRDIFDRGAVFPDTYTGAASAQLPVPSAGTYLRWNVAATALENASLDVLGNTTFTQSGVGAVARTWTSKVGEIVSVKDFGAVGDGVTDDYAAFAKAYTAAVAANRRLYIPGVPAGLFYKLTQAFSISHDNFSLIGDGRSSIVCAFNATGLNGITVIADHVSIRDLAITGTDGSGHGLKAGTTANSAYYGHYENLWISWMGANSLDVEHALSSVFIAVNMDHETNPDPITLPGGTLKGQRLNGVNVRKHSPANNNNLTFIGCIVNAASNSTTGWELQVGVDGTGGFTTLYWIGGLIQSYDKLINVNGVTHVHFQQVYAEPSVSPGTITVDGSTFVTFEKMILDANVTYTNSPRGAMKSVQFNAVTLTGTSTGFVGENLVYGGSSGTLTDNTGTAVFRNTVSSATSFAVGHSFAVPTAKVFGSSMEEWIGGGAPATPSGFYNHGATIARETVTKRTGSYSMKVTVGAASFLSGARIDIPSEVIANGAPFVVDVWAYVTAGDLGGVSLILDGGASTVDAAISTTGSWVRRVFKFATTAGAYSNGYLLFTGDAAAIVYYDIIDLYIEGYTPPKTKTLADSATPDLGAIGNGGPQIQHATTNVANTTITGFTGMHVGVPFWLTLGGAIDFTDGAGLQLAGGANFTTGVAGDVIGFVYGADGVTREIGRSIN